MYIGEWQIIASNLVNYTVFGSSEKITMFLFYMPSKSSGLYYLTTRLVRGIINNIRLKFNHDDV
jgi:hypothetical protein